MRTEAFHKVQIRKVFQLQTGLQTKCYFVFLNVKCINFTNCPSLLRIIRTIIVKKITNSDLIWSSFKKNFRMNGCQTIKNTSMPSNKLLNKQIFQTVFIFILGNLIRSRSMRGKFYSVRILMWSENMSSDDLLVVR